MQLVFSQILIILLYVMVGLAAGKAGMINPEQRKYLSGLCSNLIVPFTILSASSMEVGGREIASMLMAFAFTLALYVCTTVATLMVCRSKGVAQSKTAATASLLTYPNCTFLGLPLCRALFGDIAVLYNASALIGFNLLFFSLQNSLFTGGRMNPKNLLNSALLSTLGMIVMLIFKLHFPAPVQTVCSGIGSMITPLSLMIIGVMMSESRLSIILKERRSYLIVALRNLALPIAAMPLLRLLPLDSQARLCVLIYFACPCATLSSIYAIKYDKEPEFCAHTVLLSTLLFAVTLPVIIGVGQMLL